MKTSILRYFILAYFIVFSISGRAQEEQASAAELAKELANPNTVLGTMNFNFDYMHYQGDLPGAVNLSFRYH